MPAEFCRTCGQKLCSRCWECKNPSCSDNSCECSGNMSNPINDHIIGFGEDDGR